MLKEELKARKRVLRRLEYTNAENVVQTKGRTACEIRQRPTAPRKAPRPVALPYRAVLAIMRTRYCDCYCDHYSYPLL